MIRRQSATLAAVCLAAMLALALPRAAADELFLAGQGPPGPSSLWLAGVGGDTTFIHILDTDHWSLIAQSQGQATAICPVAQTLHVFYAGRGYQIYERQVELERWQDRPGPLWPKELGERAVIATCAGLAGQGRPTTAPTQPAQGAPAATTAAATTPTQFTLYILLGPASSAAATAPQTQASAPVVAETLPAASAGGAPAGNPPGREPVFLGFADWQWYSLPAPPAGLMPPIGKASLAMMLDGLYLLTSTADGLPTGWARFEDGRWTKLELPPLEESARVGGLIGLGPDLLLWGTTASDGRQVWFARLDGRGGTLGPIRQVHWNNTGQRIAPEDAVVLSAHGKALAMAWGASGQWHTAGVSLEGQVNALPDVTDHPMPSQQLGVWFTWIQAALAMLLVLGLLSRQRRDMLKPFALPAGAIPSPWLKRVMAFLIDFLPFWFAGMFLTGYGQMDEAQIRRVFNQIMQGRQPEVSFLPPVLLSWGLYVGYAILAEKTFSATIGKLALRMRVVSAEGRSPSWAQIIIRNVCKPVEVLSPVPMDLVFIFWPVFNRLRRRAGDIVAGTAVIEVTFRPAVIGPAVPPPQEDQTEESPGSGASSKEAGARVEPPEIPNPKSQIPNKLQISNSKGEETTLCCHARRCTRRLEFGAWDFASRRWRVFGIWDLEFRISCSRRQR